MVRASASQVVSGSMGLISSTARLTPHAIFRDMLDVRKSLVLEDYTCGSDECAPTLPVESWTRYLYANIHSSGACHTLQLRHLPY